MTAGYGDVPILHDVSVHVERGQKIALVGPNGAGKTTLLKMILGDLPAMAGTAEIGQSVTVARSEPPPAHELHPPLPLPQVVGDPHCRDHAPGHSRPPHLAPIGLP